MLVFGFSYLRWWWPVTVALVQRMHNRLTVGQLTHLHRTIGTAREQATVAIDLQLRDALANMLEEAAARMFAGERVQHCVLGQSPHLVLGWKSLFIVVNVDRMESGDGWGGAYLDVTVR